MGRGQRGVRRACSDPMTEPSPAVPRVLVANRGEIAVRIVRACRDLGYESVAVHSDVDAGDLASRLADRSVCIGPADAARSYRSIGTLITVAQATGCTGVHPGYGFLAESAEFAHAVNDAGLVFVGPSAGSIETMGDKIAAREAASRLDVPIVPGATLTGVEPEAALAAIYDIGFPVLIKAAAGGGGRGIRQVRSATEFSMAFAEAATESAAVFGSDELYVERFIPAARHVEVQVFGDGTGGCVVLGERDCSVQRRHQKLIEEAPSPAVSVETRAQMFEASARLAGGIGYAGAGTVEFLYDMATGTFHFIEMNTRIQVEHPVTEMLHGVDLVAEQLRFAFTNEVRLTNVDPAANVWHAIECRINAEHPQTFLPHPGNLESFVTPGGPGVRVDTHCHTGAAISPYYDSMIAKVIVTAPTRPAALARMRRALREFEIRGVQTTVRFHQAVLETAEFTESRHTTSWLESAALRMHLDPKDESAKTGG
jgi:acetyl-CoA carboxylase, biotin carboxylase subunit